MMDESTVVRFVQDLPWPSNARPVVKFAELSNGAFEVLLHEPISKGWKDVSRIRAHTPECALRIALREWFVKKRMSAVDARNEEIAQAIWSLVN